MPGSPKDLAGFASKLGEPDRAPASPEERERLAIGVLGAALAIALHQQGWRLSALPGADVVLQRDRPRVEPFRVIQD